jgi:hypothetical protein
MRQTGLVLRLAAVPAIVAGLVLCVLGGAAAAQEEWGFSAAGTGAGDEEATLEIHTAECYTGVGPDIYEACHADAVEGVVFTVNGAVATTDADGYVGFHGPPSTVTIAEDPDTFALYLGAYVYCRDFADDDVYYDDSATDSGGVVTLEIAAGDRVVCDWYVIYQADDDGSSSDDGDDAAGVGGVTTLPSTGTGTRETGPWRGAAPVLAAGCVLAAAATLRRRRLT